MQLYLPGSPWKDRWISLDSEVSGLASNSRVLALATCLFVSGAWADQWSAFFDPTKPETSFGRSFEEIEGNLSRSKVWVSFNLDFELDRLTYEFGLLRKRFSDFSNNVLLIDVQSLHSCLVKADRNLRLREVASFWDVGASGGTTWDDAKITGEILAKMLHRLPDGVEDMRRFQTEATSYARALRSIRPPKV